MNARASFNDAAEANRSRDEDAAEDKAARAEYYTDKAESVLKMEVAAALLSGDTAAKRITVPMVGVKWSALTMVQDHLGSATGDATLAALLGFVAKLAMTGDKAALAWIDARAKEHADFHASDLADEWAEDDAARAEDHAAQDQWERRMEQAAEYAA